MKKQVPTKDDARKVVFDFSDVEPVQVHMGQNVPVGVNITCTNNVSRQGDQSGEDNNFHNSGFLSAPPGFNVVMFHLPRHSSSEPTVETLSSSYIKGSNMKYRKKQVWIL